MKRTFALILLACSFMMASCAVITDHMASQLPEASISDSNADPYVAMLHGLPVRVFDPNLPEYNRQAFGQRSDDVAVEGGHNGCDTRNDTLARDLTEVAFKPGTRDCVVTSGVLADPYTGATINFVRGNGTSEEVPIDHVVALADAWYAGAHLWEESRRQDFANDPINLQATTKDANRAKSAKTADAWLPPNPDYHCDYARRQIEIKTRYYLAVTDAERFALEQVLGTCL